MSYLSSYSHCVAHCGEGGGNPTGLWACQQTLDSSWAWMGVDLMIQWCSEVHACTLRWRKSYPPVRKPLACCRGRAKQAPLIVIPLKRTPFVIVWLCMMMHVSPYDYMYVRGDCKLHSLTCGKSVTDHSHVLRMGTDVGIPKSAVWASREHEVRRCASKVSQPNGTWSSTIPAINEELSPLVMTMILGVADPQFTKVNHTRSILLTWIASFSVSQYVHCNALILPS